MVQKKELERSKDLTLTNTSESIVFERFESRIFHFDIIKLLTTNFAKDLKLLTGCASYV